LHFSTTRLHLFETEWIDFVRAWGFWGFVWYIYIYLRWVLGLVCFKGMENEKETGVKRAFGFPNNVYLGQDWREKRSLPLIPCFFFPSSSSLYVRDWRILNSKREASLFGFWLAIFCFIYISFGGLAGVLAMVGLTVDF